MGPARCERPKEVVEMAPAYYFWLNPFLIFSWALVFSEFALWGVLQVVLQHGKKLDPKRDPDGEDMALQLEGCEVS